MNIDTIAPTASDDIKSGWQKTAQTVTISDADAGVSQGTGSGPASLVCTLDGVDQTLPAAGGSFAVATDGKHTITYYVVDGAGNQSATQTKSLWIDATAPTTSATTTPAGWTNGPVQVTLTATDTGGSTLDKTYYKIGATGATQTYTTPFTVSDATTVTYWSTDSPATKRPTSSSRRRSTSWRRSSPTTSRAAGRPRRRPSTSRPQTRAAPAWRSSSAPSTATPSPCRSPAAPSR